VQANGASPTCNICRQPKKAQEKLVTIRRVTLCEGCIVTLYDLVRNPVPDPVAEPATITVLLPGAALNDHVGEPRYQAEMVYRCRQAGDSLQVLEEVRPDFI
jgi:hypothetical protein